MGICTRIAIHLGSADICFYQGKKQAYSRATRLFFNAERRKKLQEGEMAIKYQQCLDLLDLIVP